VFGDDAFVIPACIAITSVMPVAVSNIYGMPEGLALDADAFSIPNNAPPASQLQAFDANAFNMQCMPAVALPTEPHHTPRNPVSPTFSQSGEYLHFTGDESLTYQQSCVSPSGEYLHILLVMSHLHIFRDAAHDTKLNL